MLGTGVVSLPYHHPFNVAQRIVQLDQMTNGRAMFGSGPGRAAVGRPHARHRPDAAARPPGRGDGRDHPPAQRRRALLLRVRLVRAARRPAADPAGAGAHADGDGVVDLPVRHAAGRQVRHRRAVDRIQLDRGHPGAADAVGVRRGGRRAARVDGRPRRLASADGVPPRRDPGAGAQRGRPRPAPLAQRVQRRHARPARRGRRRGPVGHARGDRWPVAPPVPGRP